MTVGAGIVVGRAKLDQYEASAREWVLRDTRGSIELERHLSDCACCPKLAQEALRQFAEDKAAAQIVCGLAHLGLARALVSAHDHLTPTEETLP